MQTATAMDVTPATVNQTGEVLLTMSAEAPSLTHKEAAASLALASIIAPEAPDSARQPLEVVVVADRSGSMAGEKMNKMKTTLKFLVEKGLQSGDTLGLVAFDNTVDTRLPLTKMDGAGRKKALDAIAQLNVGGTTNLSGGLLQGCDLLLNKPETGATATRAVLLFTDGMANAGIQDTPGILAASAGVIAGRSCSLFTFGFGSDHNEECLRALAESTSGLYYFIEKSEDIPTAFADCLGGLVSVVAQNATLVLEGSDAATVAKVHGSYKTEADAATKRTTVSLGDLYSEDEKDVLIALELPALPTAAAAAPAVRATLRYFNVATAKMEERSTVLEIARPEATPTAQPLNLKIDEQRNRVALAEAMESASRAADGGRLAEGRELLQAAVAAAARTPSAATPLVSALRGDCEKLLSGYADEAEYGRWGSKMSKASAMSHMQQRSNHSSAQVYAKKGKMSMRRAMAEQSLPESDDEDSGCEGPAVMQQLAAFSAPPALQKQGSGSGVGGPMRLAGEGERRPSLTEKIFGKKGKK